MNPLQETQVGRAGVPWVLGREAFLRSRDFEDLLHLQLQGRLWLHPPLSSPPGGHGHPGMLAGLLAEIPEGPARVPHLHRCGWKVPLWQGRQHQELGQPWVFSGWEDFEFSKVPRDHSPDGLEEKSRDFCPCHCHLSPHRIMSLQPPPDMRQGHLCSPRAVSQVDHAGCPGLLEWHQAPHSPWQ